MPFLEKDLERKLVAGVKAKGGMCIKLGYLRFIPDRLVLGPGGHVEFIEMKSPGVKPRPGQLAMHERIRALGFRVEVIDSVLQINSTITRLSKAKRQARPAGERKRAVPGDGPGENTDDFGNPQPPKGKGKNKHHPDPGAAENMRAGVAPGSDTVEIPSLGKLPKRHPRSTPGRSKEHKGRRLPDDV